MTAQAAFSSWLFFLAIGAGVVVFAAFAIAIVVVAMSLGKREE